jgi:hypothetical protein
MHGGLSKYKTGICFYSDEIDSRRKNMVKQRIGIFDRAMQQHCKYLILSFLSF